MSCEITSCSPRKRRRIPGPAGHPYWNLTNEKETQDLVEKKEEEKQAEDGISNSQSLSGIITSDRIELSLPELWKGAWLTGCIDNNIEIICENNKLYLIRNNSFLFNTNLYTIISGSNRIKHVFKVKEIMVLIKSLTIYTDGIGEVIDCFGSIKATFTHKVLKDFNDIRVGSCLILENVTIYQSSHYNFYLNITNNNIFKIYNNNTKIPIHLKQILKTFHKTLGITHKKNNIINKKKIIKNKNKNKQINNIQNINTSNPLKINKKRKYSDLADSPWLITSNNIKNRRISTSDDTLGVKPIINIEISDSDDDKPIISKGNNDKEDSDDMIILPNKNSEKEENNDESDDDIIIKDMDMNETPKGPNTLVLISDMNKCNDNNDNDNKLKDNGKKNKRKYKRKFSFKNCKKQVNKSKSKSPSIWSKHYENTNNNNNNNGNVNMFENVNGNNEIPKGTDLMCDLFAGMEEGFCFPED